MHGLGNDFVVLDARMDPLVLNPDQARRIADRREGVGCDQIITLLPAKEPGHSVFMRIQNSDGSEVDACGNATRCVGSLLMSETGGEEIEIETGAGVLRARRNGAAGSIAVDMGEPRFGWEEIPLAREMDTLKGEYDINGLHEPAFVNVGNPHAVFFVADAEEVDLVNLGPRIETDVLFPERVNVNAVSLNADGSLRLRVWERGAGLTRACGTGACASLVAASRRGVSPRRNILQLDGGELTIEWRDDNHIIMEGPVATSFHGRLRLPEAEA